MAFTDRIDLLFYPPLFSRLGLFNTLLATVAPPGKVYALWSWSNGANLHSSDEFPDVVDSLEGERIPTGLTFNDRLVEIEKPSQGAGQTCFSTKIKHGGKSVIAIKLKDEAKNP